MFHQSSPCGGLESQTKPVLVTNGSNCHGSAGGSNNSDTSSVIFSGSTKVYNGSIVNANTKAQHHLAGVQSPPSSSPSSASSSQISLPKTTVLQSQSLPNSQIRQTITSAASTAPPVEYSNLPLLCQLANDMLKADTNILRDDFAGKGDLPVQPSVVSLELSNEIFAASRNGDLNKLKSLINYMNVNIRDLNGGGSTVSFLIFVILSIRF